MNLIRLMSSVVTCGVLSSICVPMIADAKKIKDVPAIFQSQERLSISIYTDWNELLRGKKVDHLQREYVPGVLSYLDEGQEVVVPSKYQVRGWYRLNHCSFPPIKWKFDKSVGGVEDRLFAPLDGLKLVTQCGSEAYMDGSDINLARRIVREKAIYDMQSMITSWSFKTRNAAIKYFDNRFSPPHLVQSHNAFLLEVSDDLASHLVATDNGGNRIRLYNVDSPGFLRQDLKKIPMAIAYLFSYMIGNPDGLISKKELRNFKIFSDVDFPKESQTSLGMVKAYADANRATFYSVAYDFDLSQFVRMKRAFNAVEPIAYNYQVKGLCGMSTTDENQNGRSDLTDVVDTFVQKAPDLYKFLYEHKELNQLERDYLVAQIVGFYRSLGINFSMKTVEGSEGIPVLQVTTSIDKLTYQEALKKLGRVAARSCDGSAG